MNIESYLDRNVLNRVGVDDDEGPPVPIPNTEVKLISADDTWLATAWDNRTVSYTHLRFPSKGITSSYWPTIHTMSPTVLRMENSRGMPLQRYTRTSYVVFARSN